MTEHLVSPALSPLESMVDVQPECGAVPRSCATSSEPCVGCPPPSSRPALGMPCIGTRCPLKALTQPKQRDSLQSGGAVLSLHISALFLFSLNLDCCFVSMLLSACARAQVHAQRAMEVYSRACLFLEFIMCSYPRDFMSIPIVESSTAPSSQN